MKTEKSRMNLITEGSIFKALMSLFFPILFGTFFQQLYSTTDAIIVGKFVSTEALGAVGGTTGTLINLLIGFFTGLSSGASVVIAQYYGGKKDNELQRSVHTAMALALVGGLVLMVIGIGFAPMIMKAMGTPDTILHYSVTFIRIYFLGIIPNLIYNMGTSILRAIGDTKRPLYYLIVSCLTNIGLDLIFVPIFHLGIVGAGLATVLSQILSAILILRTLLRSGEKYQVQIKRIHFDGMVLRRIFSIGLPAGLQSSMYAISNVIIQSFVNGFGTDTIAAWTAYSKIDSLFWMSIGALGISVATFVGQNYGAKRMDRVKLCVRMSYLLALVGSVAVSLLLYVFCPLLFKLFSNETVVIDIGIDILRFMVPAFITYITIEILASTLRGIGDSIIPMIMTCGGICALRIIWIFTGTKIWPGLHTVLTSYPLTWTITSILFVIYYFRFSHMRKAKLVFK
jgi:putative MATE family efflux protein